jgi:hypothetical protein
MYWTREHNDLLATWKTSRSEKVFNELYPTLMILVDNVIQKYASHSDLNEINLRHEIASYLVERVLPLVRTDNVRNTFNYLTLSARNYIYTRHHAQQWEKPVEQDFFDVYDMSNNYRSGENRSGEDVNSFEIIMSVVDHLHACVCRELRDATAYQKRERQYDLDLILSISGIVAHSITSETQIAIPAPSYILDELGFTKYARVRARNIYHRHFNKGVRPKKML